MYIYLWLTGKWYKLYMSQVDTRFVSQLEKKKLHKFSYISAHLSSGHTELNAWNVVKTDKYVVNVQRIPQSNCNASITHGATKPSDYSFPFSCISWHSIATPQSYFYFFLVFASFLFFHCLQNATNAPLENQYIFSGTTTTNIGSSCIHIHTHKHRNNDWEQVMWRHTVL